jgi:hypothetical protein
LDRDLEVTGHPIATLYLSATTTDTTVFAYLEDIDEQGQVTYVTEGLLRALHRKLSNPPAGYPPFIPHRSFKRKDALSLHPGEVFQLVFDLFPTSYQFKKGHQIRLSLAGTDRDHFAQPIGKTPALSFYHTPRYPSHLVLPTPQEPS